MSLTEVSNLENLNIGPGSLHWLRGSVMLRPAEPDLDHASEGSPGLYINPFGVFKRPAVRGRAFFLPAAGPCKFRERRKRRDFYV